MSDNDLNSNEFLQQQLVRTRATWARLNEHGITNGSQVQLDFFYAARTNASARQLKQFLEQETDYHMLVTADRDDWILRGHTQRAPLTLDMIEQWVDWTVTAGLQFDCVFDGWGAEA